MDAEKKQPPAVRHPGPAPDRAFWQEVLPPAAFQVLFERATEAPGSSALNDESRVGTYVCGACFAPLFASESRDGRSLGWPTFRDPMHGSVAVRRETRGVHTRLSYACATCGGHQGHVTRDLPWIWRLRWCNNGLALRFIPDGESLPRLRLPSP